MTTLKQTCRICGCDFTDYYLIDNCCPECRGSIPDEPAQPAPDLLAVLDDEGLIAKVVCKFDAPRIAREAICAYRAALWERVKEGK